MFIIRCCDCGYNCNWEEIGDTKAELVEFMIEHLQWDHEIESIPPQLKKKIQDAVEPYEEENFDDSFEEEEEKY